MILRLYWIHVNYLSNILYEKKVNRNEAKKLRSGNNNIIVWHPIALIGIFYGKLIGRELRGMKSESLSEVPKNIFKLTYGVITSFIIFWSVLISSYILFVTGVLPASDDVGALSFPLAIFIAIAPNIHARYLVRNDFKLMINLGEIGNNRSTEDIDKPIQHLDHRRYAIRFEAAHALVSIISESPGKAIKYSSKDPEEICEILIQQLQKDEREIQELCIQCLSWISRDYRRVLLPHAELFAKLIRSDHTPFQIHSTTILGNLELSSSEEVKKCANMIKPAVKDPDADVRAKAAKSLGNLPCEYSLNMLHHLEEDVDSEVCQRASESLSKVNEYAS